MKVSKKIANKVEQYQKLKAKVDELYQQLNSYFEDELGVEGFYDAFITDETEGTKQTEDGEYCDQRTLGEDWYKGVYYYPIKNSDNYIGCRYEI